MFKSEKNSNNENGVVIGVPMNQVQNKTNQPKYENQYISYDSLNSKLKIKEAIKPIFFFENSDNKEGILLNSPSPFDVAQMDFEVFVESINSYHNQDVLNSVYLTQRSVRYKYIKNITTEYICAIHANIEAIFYNGLYQFLRDYLTIDQEKVAEIIELNSNLYCYSDIRSFVDNILKLINGNHDQAITIVIADTLSEIVSQIANKYFDFISKILLYGYVDMPNLIHRITSEDKINPTDIDTKMYYMYIHSCLEELAREDIFKCSEIIEANLFSISYRILSEYHSIDMNNLPNKIKMNKYRDIDEDEF